MLRPKPGFWWWCLVSVFYILRLLYFICSPDWPGTHTYIHTHTHTNTYQAGFECTDSPAFASQVLVLMVFIITTTQSSWFSFNQIWRGEVRRTEKIAREWSPTSVFAEVSCLLRVKNSNTIKSMQIAHIKPGVAAHACHPNTWKTEAWQLVLGQPELHDTLSKKKSLHTDNTPFIHR